MPLGEIEQKAIRHLLNEANQIRRRSKLKTPILKAGDDKTAPEEPEMLSQVGTIIKRIRAKTDPAGSAELGLAEKKAGFFSFMGGVAGGLGKGLPKKMMVGTAAKAAPMVAGGRPMGGAARAAIARPPAPKPVGGLPHVDPGLWGPKRAPSGTGTAVSGMMGGGQHAGWEKLTREQALALLKAALYRTSA